MAPVWYVDSRGESTMAKSERQKLKLLILRDYLRSHTDEQHPVSMQQILAALEGEGIRAERKSVYDDLDTLRDYGMEIRKVSDKTLIGASPSNIRHFVELRGIGIINARQLFGMGAVKVSEKIDMVVELELWNPEKVYDRMGVDNHYVSILGVKVPSLTIHVKPGRNLAVILEVAAMNNRQKKMGYNAAQELLDNLGLDMESSDTVKSMG